MSLPALARDARSSGFSEKPYIRGYHPPAHLRDVIARAHRTRLWYTIASTLADHFVAIGFAVVAAWGMVALPLWITTPLGIVACVGIARQLQALECMIHEGSHFNWSRHRRNTNDFLAFLLAGLPLGASVQAYRPGHLMHHGRFGTSDDPDRAFYHELSLEAVPRDSLASYVRDLLVRQINIVRRGRDKLDWSPRARPIFMVFPFVWACVVVGFPVGILFGRAAGFYATLLWIVAYIMVFPVIRLANAADEHVYSDAATVFDATVSNFGWWQRLILHPHNDGYHTVHHLWPGVPHHQLRRLHNDLVSQDSDGYAKRVRCRTRVLQTPIRGVEHPVSK